MSSLPDVAHQAAAPLDDLELVAVTARQRAYAPYSRFMVGAAVRTEGGAIFGGCNVENASYGLTVCAERVAVFAAVAAGHRRITDVVVVTDASPPSAPCGACRQVLGEFGPSARVVAFNGRGERWESTVGELLPRSFGLKPPGTKLPG